MCHQFELDTTALQNFGKTYYRCNDGEQKWLRENFISMDEETGLPYGYCIDDALAFDTKEDATNLSNGIKVIELEETPKEEKEDGRES